MRRLNTDAPVENELLMLGVHDIDDNPFQPRREFSEPEIVSLASRKPQRTRYAATRARSPRRRAMAADFRRTATSSGNSGGLDAGAGSRFELADDRLVAELAIVENSATQRPQPDRESALFPPLFG